MLIQNIEIHRCCMQIDPTVIWVLLGLARILHE
jgi:hypothetical protein